MYTLGMDSQTFVTKFYEEALGPRPVWKVTGVSKGKEEKEVCISAEYASREYRCPVCGGLSKARGFRIRRLRHLDACDYQAIAEAKVPGVKRPKRKARQIPVPFAEKHSVYTELFGNKVIEMLKTMTTKAASRIGLGRDAAGNIKQRAARRGLARREKAGARDLGINEAPYQKGHDYVTVIINKDTGSVLDVLGKRGAGTVKARFKRQEAAYFGFLESVPADTGGSFLKAAKELFPERERRVCYDRFHVPRLINKAPGKAGRIEYALLEKGSGDNPLKKHRFGFLINPGRAGNRGAGRRGFIKVTKPSLKASRVRRIKEALTLLREYEYRGAA